MPEHTISARTFVVVCIILIILTFLTVGVSFLHLEGHWHLILGLTIAILKASLVVLFFMHVLISSRLTWMMILVAVFWFAILLTLTLADYFSRDMIPFTPGH